jgi:hypothetical protein
MTITTEDLKTITDAYIECGRELAAMPAEDRRRTIGAIVKAIGSQSPESVADMAGAASLAVLRVGGAK